MRQLRLVFARTDGLRKVLVAATLLPLAGSCGGKGDAAASNANAGNGTTATATGSSGGTVNSSSSSSSVGATTTGGSASTNVGGSTNTFATEPAGGSPNTCPSYSSEQSYVVPIPSQGAMSDMAEACNWTGDFGANAPAASISLTDDPANAAKASGVLTIASDVAANAGYLVVASISVAGGTVSSLRRVNSQYYFDVTWSDGQLPYLGETRTFQVNVTMACAPEMSYTQSLQIASNVVRCGSYAAPIWVSGGDTCRICQPMMEPVAQPMPAPSKGPDGLPLPGELRFAIMPVARDGRYLVLHVSKPEGAANPSLAWHASAGEVLLVADDLAIWTLPDEPGPHQVQVAAESEDAAGIEVYLHRDEACQIG